MSVAISGFPVRVGTTAALAAITLIAAGCTNTGRVKSTATMDWIHVTPDADGFVLLPSGRPFVPWGFNYDHDEAERLLEEYWRSEWTKVEQDFREMKALGANVVRVHLQFGRFMRGPGEPNAEALEQLDRLVALAEQLGLYLNLTGLGCYLKDEVPAWYDELSEAGRWDVQAAFWETIASRYAESPAIFCYNLMNEPVVPGAKRSPGDWLAPPFADKFHYVQFVTLDPAGQQRPTIAAAWVRTLVWAIRRHDHRHLVTVGLVPWSLDRPGLTSGFVPTAIAPELDFLSVHLYPESGGVEEALATLAGFAVGKPVVIEETFPLRCSLDEMRTFLRDSRRHAAGWLSFYWGQTPAEGRARGTLQDAIVAEWVETFSMEGQAVHGASPSCPAPTVAPSEP
jgi:hypothetical protein